MKLSSMILLVTLSLLIVAMFFSNILLKKEYAKIGKNERYWNYGRILQEPFRHLKITGGNETNFVFEENDEPSISVLKNWEGYDNKVVKAMVKNDTLFVNFNLTTKDRGELNALKRMTTVRIAAPQLLSINTFNNNLTLGNLNQKNLSIELKGKSFLLVQSSIRNIESVKIRQQDATKIVFQVAPESGSNSTLPDNPLNNLMYARDEMFVSSVDASISGISTLDFSHVMIDSIKLYVSDTSSILLSGQSLKKLKL